MDILTSEQEVALAQRVQAGLAADVSIAADPDAADVASWRCVSRDGKSAKDELVTANIGLVHTIARPYQSRGLDMDDLMQEGVIGLMAAADRFDPAKGTRFGSYAAFWIRKAVSKAVAETGSVLRVPTQVQEHLWKVKRAAEEFRQEHGRDATPQDLAAVLDFDVVKVRSLLRQLRTTGLVSLDSARSPRNSPDGDSVTLADVLAGDDDVMSGVAHSMMFQDLTGLMSTLTTQEGDVLVRRFGLGDSQEPSSLAMIGDQLGLSRERVRQVESIAMRKLRAAATPESPYGQMQAYLT